MSEGVAFGVLSLIFLVFFCVHKILNMSPFVLRVIYTIVREREPKSILAKVKKNITMRIIGAYAYCRGWGMR